MMTSIARQTHLRQPMLVMKQAEHGDYAGGEVHGQRVGLVQARPPDAVEAPFAPAGELGQDGQDQAPCGVTEQDDAQVLLGIHHPVDEPERDQVFDELRAAFEMFDRIERPEVLDPHPGGVHDQENGRAAGEPRRLRGQAATMEK
jgi:hypothetical protein